MKAAVIQQEGTTPAYVDIASPTPTTDQQVLVTVRAAAIKQLDLLLAAGRHYTHYPTLPTVVGVDGVGVLADGRRIYALGLTGMMAEQALVTRDRWTVLPDGLDDALAAALPNALIGADLPLRCRANLQAGETVLVHGATGSTGLMAVQLAKYHGAARVIATGRKPAALQQLRELGADEVVSLAQPDEAVVQQLRGVYARTPFSLVIDYLWGHPTALLLTALQGAAGNQPVRLVTVGEAAGPTLTVASGLLRGRAIELLGSGIGSILPSEISRYLQQDMPALLAQAAAGHLRLAVETRPLREVAQAWSEAATSGPRLVLTMP